MKEVSTNNFSDADDADYTDDADSFCFLFV